MIDSAWMKSAILAAVARVPVYRLVRNPRLRDYLAVQYLGRTASEKIPGYVSATGRLPTFRYSTVLMALDALAREGNAPRIKEAALQVLAANPERLEPYLLLSDVAWQHGDYEASLDYARTAWLLHPASLVAASKVIRLGYLAGQDRQANRDAVVALQRFGCEGGLLWLACKYCRSREQLEKIMGSARLPSDKPKKISALARPLATAALRSDCLDVALDLYLEACVIELSGAGAAEPVATKSLAGKGGSVVLQELRKALEAEGIPFFFAAGTALGLVRNGKPLDHDNDIDVGIFEQDWDRERLIRIFRQHPDFDLDDTNPKSPKIGILHRGGASIDLFKFYRSGDGIFHDAIFVRWKNTPFSIERATLETGDVVYLPGDIDRYLTENYGDWRTPDSTFDAFVDGPNMEVTWPEYMVVHRVRRAYKYIRAADLLAARQELEAVQGSLMRFRHGRTLGREMWLDVEGSDEREAASPSQSERGVGAPEEEIQEVGFSPRALKNPALLLQRAQLARIAGSPEWGRGLLESAIRAGGWTTPKLWWELVSLVSCPEDYARLRDLWLSSPEPCHSNPSILRAMARAAAVTGSHDESRALLRKLISVVGGPAVTPVADRGDGKAGIGKVEFASKAVLALVDLNQAFSDIGLRAFLISGTLLGKVRDNGIIGWDKDIDVGYFREECSVDLEGHFLKHGKFRIGRVDLTSDRLRVIHKNGTWIDVFPHYMEAGRRWHDGTATRWWNTPFGLKSIDFLGIQQYVPDDPELYLDENYGDWKRPNPHFDARLDAPNVEVIDPGHFLSLLYFGLESSIRNGKDVMRRRYVGLLRERGEGAWLDRV